MSTRSMICMKLKDDNYKSIYCHSDGYLEYNGAMLIDYYKDRKKVEELLELGNISCLNEKVHPDPTRPHSFDYDKQQEDVVVAYMRDRGEKGQEAILLTMEDLRSDDRRAQYIYIFDENDEWKYIKSPFSLSELKDVNEDLEQIYKKMGLRKRPPNVYGGLRDEELERLKKQQDSQGELWKIIFKNQETKS